MAIAVVKVGTSSITSERGEIDDASLLKLCQEIADGPRRPATRSCW